MKDVAYLTDDELKRDFMELCAQILVLLAEWKVEIITTRTHWENIEKMWERVGDIYQEMYKRA